MSGRAASNPCLLTRRAWLAAAGSAAGLRAAESREERGARIIQGALGALGGDAFLNMRDRVEEGRAYSFYRARLAGLSRMKVYARYLTRPEPPTAGFFGLRVRQSFGKDEDSAAVFLEDGTGLDISYRGARPIPAEDGQRFVDTQLRNFLYILRMRLGEPGLIFESQGRDVVDNQPAEAVDITDSQNRVVTVWFHESSKLPVRQRTIRRTGGERSEEVTTFAKFRDAGGGVQWPHTIVRTRDGEKIFEQFSESIAVNQGLPDNLFTISADTKILKKK
jgi:hypothetical protein